MTVSVDFLVRACRIWNCLANELDFSFMSSLFISFDCDDPQTFPQSVLVFVPYIA